MYTAINGEKRRYNRFYTTTHRPPPFNLTAIFGPGIMFVNYGASGMNTRCNFDPKIHAQPVYHLQPYLVSQLLGTQPWSSINRAFKTGAQTEPPDSIALTNLPQAFFIARTIGS
ncbi:hypothetical protein N7463_010382 [Penicillium fimorum]|uniref:Uncharacterized protein n=1 Tax=Penicillium fimorum TaxID=1882269 RepID=A0A9W9XKJ4_9EURO|nr:hypothetical protein N7463_010382 [Penicillium fimorum]